uniref:Putative ribonuclease H-like domain-containing protein n=1 Tax=Tanacetum cinerariifolium TaxID=118510 RepID=A0A6L2K880_TANCI|nr:putative ribonuclease H-like domain-containing protein [Tanacetum cinerariifolium]
MAFVSSHSPNSTNEVPADFEVSIASPQVSTANLSDATVYAFLANHPHGSRLVHEDLEQIHEDDLEEKDLLWMGQFVRECRVPMNKENKNMNQETTRRIVNVEDASSKAMVAIDGAGFDWSYMANDEAPTNMTFMAFSDSDVYTDNTCFKTCLKNYATLKTQYDELRVEFNKYKCKLADYKRGLALVEEQLVHYKTNESLLNENIVVLKRDILIKESEIAVLKNMLGYVSYNVVPPPHTERFSPLRIDLSNIGLPKFVEPSVQIYGVKPIKVVTRTSSVKISEHVKENNGALIIKDWESEGDNEVESSPEVERKTVEPSVDKVEVDIPKQNDKHVRRPVKYAEMYRTQRPKGNISYLTDFKEFDEGYIAFGGGAKGADESHVLLKVPRKNNMYSVDMKNIVPKKDLTCLCKKQTAVATSTTKAEYMAAASCCGQVLWIQNQLLDYGLTFTGEAQHIWLSLILDNKMIKYELSNEFCDKHNMVAFLKNPQGSEDFHQIVDFLNASHIRTLENREIELNATVDGQVKTIIEESVRRHLKLADVVGISTLSTTEIFEQLDLMGKTRTKTRRIGIRIPQSNVPTSVADEAITKEMHDGLGRATTTASNLEADPVQARPERLSNLPNEPSLEESNTSRSEEGSMQLLELIDICTKLSEKVTTLENELTSTKAVYNTALITLTKRVKKLEKKIKHKRRRAVIESSKDEEANDDETLAETLLNIKMSAAKDKGKAIMQEFEPPKEIKKKEMTQISLDDCSKEQEDEEEIVQQEDVVAKQAEEESSKKAGGRLKRKTSKAREDKDKRRKK